MASWYLAPALVALRTQINRAFPGRDRSTDGAIGDAAHNARKSDHNADWDSVPPGIVRAIDVDRDFIPGDVNASITASQAMVDAIITDPRVSYVIYRSRIWQNPAVYSRGGWQSYVGKPVGAPNPHVQHFHVSLRHGTKFERDESPWPMPGTSSVLKPGTGATITPTPSPEEDDMIILYSGKYPSGVAFIGGGISILRTAEEKANLVKAGAREAWVEDLTLSELISSARGKYTNVATRQG